MAGPWLWSTAAHRYRNTRTGRFLGPTEMVSLRDVYLDSKKIGAGDLTVRLANGEMDVAQWQRIMRNDVKNSYIDQYVLGHGGRGTMTQADWGRIGAMVKEQYRYLDGFARAVADDTLSEAQIRTRAGMYHDSSVQAYERGHSQMMGVPTLPAYPGDGSTACHSNCRCHWDIREVNGGWDCYWVVMGGGEMCEDCAQRGDEWSPYEVRV
jgi:hypothetical protein